MQIYLRNATEILEVIILLSMPPVFKLNFYKFW